MGGGPVSVGHPATWVTVGFDQPLSGASAALLDGLQFALSQPGQNEPDQLPDSAVRVDGVVRCLDAFSVGFAPLEQFVAVDGAPGQAVDFPTGQHVPLAHAGGVGGVTAGAGFAGGVDRPEPRPQAGGFERIPAAGHVDVVGPPDQDVPDAGLLCDVRHPILDVAPLAGDRRGALELPGQPASAQDTHRLTHGPSTSFRRSEGR